jgi:hypothetical protein
MTKQSTTTVRGAKTRLIEKLARRPGGVSGVEIMKATGWKSGSAAWRVGVLAQMLDMDYEDLGRDENGQVHYRLVPKAPAKKSKKTATAKPPADAAAA